LLQADRDEAIFLLFFQLLSDELDQTLLSLSLEMSPVPALHDFVFIQSDEVEAVPFQLLSIVSMSNQEDLEDILHTNERLQMTSADVDQSWQHEVISKHEQP
jgi:hypothetical protein